MENFVLRERLVDKNGWQLYVYHQADISAVLGIPTHYVRVGTTEIERSMILTPQHRFKLQLILSSVANYLSQG